MPEMSAPILLGSETKAPEPETPEPRESEFARVEALLALRTRSFGSLQQELDRRDRLLREALDRISTVSSAEIAALRSRYDTAADRAVEAELARAELRFALDETRAQLTAAPHAGPVRASTDAPALYARVTELQQAEEELKARLKQTERDRDAAAARNRDLERKAHEAAELLAAATRQEHAVRAAASSREHALRGERAGLQARLAETERAWQSAAVRQRKLTQRGEELEIKLSEVKTERSEVALLAHARSTRVSELEQALSVEQLQVRSLRAQITAQTEASEAERERLQERVRTLEAREQLPERANADMPGSSTQQLNEFLTTLEQPLRQLDAALDNLQPVPRAHPVTHALRSEPEVDATLTANETRDARDAYFNEQLASAARRIHELEAALLAKTRAAPAAAPATATASSRTAPPPPRTEAGRLVEDLAKERARRRKLAVTVRALQAASESGEAVGPWIEDLVDILAEGGSLPPKNSSTPST
jgi:chromosome segregation ATPase